MTAPDAATIPGAHPLTPDAPPAQALLGTTRMPAGYDVARVVLRDGARRGAIAVRPRQGIARRAEPGPVGPLVLEVRTEGSDAVIEVWGSPATPADAVEKAIEAAIAWAALRDTPGDAHDVVAGHERARDLVRHVGEVRLSCLPRLGEAFGRSVLSQLVQGVEARRSIAQVAAAPVPGLPEACGPGRRSRRSGQPRPGRCGAAGSRCAARGRSTRAPWPITGSLRR